MRRLVFLASLYRPDLVFLKVCGLPVLFINAGHLFHLCYALHRLAHTVLTFSRPSVMVPENSGDSWPLEYPTQHQDSKAFLSRGMIEAYLISGHR
jgi:hypothetical protein